MNAIRLDCHEFVVCLCLGFDDTHTHTHIQCIFNNKLKGSVSEDGLQRNAIQSLVSSKVLLNWHRTTKRFSSQLCNNKARHRSIPICVLLYFFHSGSVCVCAVRLHDINSGRLLSSALFSDSCTLCSLCISASYTDEALDLKESKHVSTALTNST